jgi:white-opaque regulator 2
MGYEPALSAGVSSPGSTSQQFDYSSAIDPALEAVVPPPAKSSGQFQPTSSGMPNFREDLKRELQSASPYSSGASDSPHLRGGASLFFSSNSSQFSENEYESSAYASTPAKGRMKIDDLLSLGGPVPPTVPGKLQEPDFLEELKHLYHSIYSPGLENFLETKWFPVKGIAKLLGDNQLLEQCATLLDQFAKTPSNSERDMAYTSSVEARVVWGLASMVRTAAASESSNGVKSEGTIPAPDDATEAGNRLMVFEYLLCGVIADRNLLTKPSGAGDPHRMRELDFWYNLGKFVTLDQATSVQDMDETLATLRNLLDGRENRDVLYSIAIVRAMSNRVAEYSEQDRPLHLDETDPRSKLAVAKRFVKDEGNGNGTTNVIRRLCELATRSWTTAGLTK